MRVSTMIRTSPRTDPDSGLMDRVTDFARQVEARGFPGIWIGDSLGRGRPTLDSLQVLTALAAVTRRVELGISVLQLRCATRSSSPTGCNHFRRCRTTA
jgi:alkanesulfonate monooxygenase SsuD/methylene tetrahydromethanopterin reductase-like flavin-dependent oxidoreductase (luciferase family)